MANLNYAEQWSPELLEILMQGTLTSPFVTSNVRWLDAKTFHFTQMSTSGYKNHNRKGGWNTGTYDQKDIPYTLTHDRDVEFMVDKADVDETNATASIQNISRVFEQTCNVLDYATGLMASTYRSQDINSYKSIRGIMKKVCMWLLVVVGAVIDQLLLYASQTAGITLPFTFLVACIVAIWIICNEIISILENIKDMGVAIPGFLLPIVEHVKSQVEDKADINKDSEGE